LTVIEQLNFQDILQQLRKTADPAALMRSFIVQSGGQWSDHSETALFEIHFLGVAGVGVGADAAVQNWLANAEHLQFDFEKVV
jgi:hypothetical protein